MRGKEKTNQLHFCARVGLQALRLRLGTVTGRQAVGPWVCIRTCSQNGMARLIHQWWGVHTLCIGARVSCRRLPEGSERGVEGVHPRLGRNLQARNLVARVHDKSLGRLSLHICMCDRFSTPHGSSVQRSDSYHIGEGRAHKLQPAPVARLVGS